MTMGDEFPQPLDESTVDRLLTAFYRSEIPAEFRTNERDASSKPVVQSFHRPHSSRSALVAVGISLAAICSVMLAFTLETGERTGRSTVNSMSPSTPGPVSPTGAVPVHTGSSTRWMRDADAESKLEMLHPELTIEVFPIPDERPSDEPSKGKSAKGSARPESGDKRTP